MVRKAAAAAQLAGKTVQEVIGAQLSILAEHQKCERELLSPQITSEPLQMLLEELEYALDTGCAEDSCIKHLKTDVQVMPLDWQPISCTC